MLVIVHHRNVEVLFQSLFYIKAFWSFDVLKVDASKRGSYLLHGFAEFHRVFLVHFYIEDIDATVNLKEQPFAFKTGFPLMAPMSPRPNTAVPLEITATRLPLSVYL